MIVLEASAAVELLLGRSGAATVAGHLRADPEVSSIHLLDVEVASAVRRLWSGGIITAARGERALVDLARMPLERYPQTPLLARIWQLRGNMTAYDAAYVALAEVLGATLVTCDAKFAGTPGLTVKIAQ